MKLNDSTRIKKVVLKVSDLKTMVDFYSNIMGLEVYNETENHASLGVDENVILELEYDKKYEVSSTQKTGLYHIAFLVPDEKYLGQFIYHLHDKNYPLQGAGDHIFSQALYFSDPEGNGIEFYADRPKSEWVIHEDGTVESGTYEVDVQHLFEVMVREPYAKMPSGSRIGHVHLQVNDIEAARQFYINTLGYDLKTEMFSALFISKNGYHHDFGINAWAGNKIRQLNDTDTGLKTVVIETTQVPEIVETFSNQSEYQTLVNENSIKITDKAGIELEFTML